MTEPLDWSAYPYDTVAGAAKGYPSLARVDPVQGPFNRVVIAAEGALVDLRVWASRAPYIPPSELIASGFPVPRAPHWPNNDHQDDGA